MTELNHICRFRYECFIIAYVGPEVFFFFFAWIAVLLCQLNALVMIKLIKPTGDWKRLKGNLEDGFAGKT